jgi:hypothetical protein
MGDDIQDLIDRFLYNRNQSKKKLEHMKQSPACKSTRRIITARVVSSNL